MQSVLRRLTVSLGTGVAQLRIALVIGARGALVARPVEEAHSLVPMWSHRQRQVGRTVASMMARRNLRSATQLSAMWTARENGARALQAAKLRGIGHGHRRLRRAVKVQSVLRRLTVSLGKTSVQNASLMCVAFAVAQGTVVRKWLRQP